MGVIGYMGINYRLYLLRIIGKTGIGYIGIRIIDLPVRNHGVGYCRFHAGTFTFYWIGNLNFEFVRRGGGKRELDWGRVGIWYL